jgi:hypothetical protein
MSTIKIPALLVLAVALLASPVRAENISTKTLSVKDNADPAKRMVQVQSRDLGVAYADAAGPDTGGAWVHVYSDTDDHCSYLAPGLDWSTKNSIWKYKNKTTKDQAQLRDGKLLIKLRSSVAFSLADDITQGAVHLQAQFGETGVRYCMICDTPIKDDAKMFRAKDCVAAACEEEPSLCGPSLCGDLVVSSGEDCEIDDDCTGGQVCSDGCACVDAEGCGDGTVDPGEECEADGDCSGGEVCTDRCFCVDPQCPGSVQWTQHAGIGELMTSTEVDLGLNGYFHDGDRSDGAKLSLAVSDATEATPASCGEVTIGGIDPSAGNCRCANDSRQICDRPFANDADDCGGNACNCYLSPPEPMVGGGTGLCAIRRLADDIAGTWNVDSGAADLTVPQRLLIYTGGSTTTPCPVCNGDPTANDGLRGGTCDGGENDGEACDANGGDASFPLSGGGSYSYDCFPNVGSNISGSGLVFENNLTTGASSITPALPCGFSLSETCPCGTCSDDFQVACTDNADCAAVSAGVCEGKGGSAGSPNRCYDSVCTPLGGGEGYCDAGPFDSFCSGVLKANGDGVFLCDSDFDCTPGAVGIDAGTCTHDQLRKCFPGAIVTAGTADATDPVLAAAACLPESNSGYLNLALSLPGASRLHLAMSTEFPCAGAPGSDYPACP